MLPDISALDDMRAVALLYRRARLRHGPLRGHHVGTDAMVRLIRERRPELDERAASVQAFALVREAWCRSGQWIYGGPYEGVQHHPRAPCRVPE